MNLISEERVCQELGLAPETLRRWVEIGLVELCRVEDRTGFEPDQIRRIWSIASLQSDLEVNLSAVPIILELSDQIRELKLALRETMRQLDRSRRLEAFHVQILEKYTGSLEWEIEI